MKNFAFTKTNYILMAISVLLIIVGFCLMGGSSTNVGFNPDVFSFRRITLAPVVCMLGFFGMIGAIMYKKKEQKITDKPTNINKELSKDELA